MPWLSVVGDLLLGAACPGCGQPGVGLCGGCRASLAATVPRRTRPLPCPPGFPTTITGGPYDDLMRKLISAHKERQAWLLTPALSSRLAAAVVPLLCEGPVLLVPVPSSAAAVRSRGRDATAAIAAGAARRLRPDRSVRMVRLLRPVRRLADQSGLSAAQRQANLAGAYAVRKAMPGQVIIVDDLVTTGASIAEATRALTAAGWSVVGAATLAATVRTASHDRAGVVLDRDR